MSNGGCLRMLLGAWLPGIRLQRYKETRSREYAVKEMYPKGNEFERILYLSLPASVYWADLRKAFLVCNGPGPASLISISSSYSVRMGQWRHGLISWHIYHYSPKRPLCSISSLISFFHEASQRLYISKVMPKLGLNKCLHSVKTPD